MPTLSERIAVTEEATRSVDRRLGDHIDHIKGELERIDKEIELDRKTKHSHAEQITRYGAMLSSHEELFKSTAAIIKDGFGDVTKAIKELTEDNRARDKRVSRIEMGIALTLIIGGAFGGAVIWILTHKELWIFK